MNNKEDLKIIENQNPRHWGISVICVLLMLALLFFSTCFGWIFVHYHYWVEFVIEIAMTVLGFVILANLATWNLCGREIITISRNHISVTRKRFTPYVKTYNFCNLEYVEYKPFESSDVYSFWCKRLGRKGGMVHVVQFGINEYFGIAMRRSDAERLVMEIQEKMYESTD